MSPSRSAIQTSSPWWFSSATSNDRGRRPLGIRPAHNRADRRPTNGVQTRGRDRHRIPETSSKSVSEGERSPLRFKRKPHGEASLEAFRLTGTRTSFPSVDTRTNPTGRPTLPLLVRSCPMQDTFRGRTPRSRILRRKTLHDCTGQGVSRQGVVEAREISDSHLLGARLELGRV